MNTLDDLRHTLDVHARDVHDDTGRARVAAVRGRVTVVRRRRAVGVGAVAALAVVGALLVPGLGGALRPGPTDAPAERTVLGWTYQLDEAVHADGDVATLELAQSDLPRVVSWSTDGRAQDVELRLEDDRWVSDAADHADHVQLPPGFSGRVAVRGPEGLGLASYVPDLEAAPPAGVGEGVLTFREQVAGRELLGAVLGEPGAATVELVVPPVDGTVWLADVCEGLPRGVSLRLDTVGSRGFSSRGCSGSSFDPGATAGIGIPGTQRSQRLRMQLWRDGQPVTDGELPDVRLGLAAYTPSEPPLQVAEVDFEGTVEDAGHVWQIAERRVGGPGELPSLTVPGTAMHLVAGSMTGRLQTTYGLTVDGAADTFVSVTGLRGGSGTRERVAGGQQVALDLQGDPDDVVASALVLYERVD